MVTVSKSHMASGCHAVQREDSRAVVTDILHGILAFTCSGLFPPHLSLFLHCVSAKEAILCFPDEDPKPVEDRKFLSI